VVLQEFRLKLQANIGDETGPEIHDNVSVFTSLLNLKLCLPKFALYVTNSAGMVTSRSLRFHCFACTDELLVAGCGFHIMQLFLNIE